MFYVMESWSNRDATRTRTADSAESLSDAEEKAKAWNAARNGFPGSYFFVGDGVDRVESN